MIIIICVIICVSTLASTTYEEARHINISAITTHFLITFRYLSTNLNRIVHRFAALLRPLWTWRGNSPSLKKCHDDSYATRVMGTFAREAPTDRGCEGRVSLACRTSFPVDPGKSIQRLRHDVQHPRRAPERVPRWLPYCMSHCRRTPWRRRDGGEDEEGGEKRKRGGWDKGQREMATA